MSTGTEKEEIKEETREKTENSFSRESKYTLEIVWIIFTAVITKLIDLFFDIQSGLCGIIALGFVVVSLGIILALKKGKFDLEKAKWLKWGARCLLFAAVIVYIIGWVMFGQGKNNGLDDTCKGATGHVYDGDSDAECNNCGEYRAVWHYYEQWDDATFKDWELYNVEYIEDEKEVSVDTYTYRTYYWVDEKGVYRATGLKLIPEEYTLNKYLSGNEFSEYGGVTDGTDTYITTNSNGKYNILESQVFYSSQGFVKGSNKGCVIDGITYWDEVIGTEEKEETYTRSCYYFRKFY